MSKQVLGSDKLVFINNYPALGLVQSSDVAPQFGAQDIFELGRVGRVDTAYELESQGNFVVEASGNMPGLLARMVPVRSGVAFTKFLYSGLGAGTNKNAYTITEADVSEMQFDMVINERPDQVTFSRTTFVPRAFPSSISGRVDANGMGTETFNWQAQELYGFVAPYHDIKASAATRASSTTATLLDTGITASTYTLIYFWVDEKRYTTITTDSTYCTFATSTVTLVGSDTIPADAICRGVFYKTSSPTSTFPQLALAQRGTVAFYVKGWQADFFLNMADPNNPADSERLQRVQSAEYTIDFNLTPLRQILKNTAGTAIYCRVPTTPYNVSLTCSVYEADWGEWKRILNTGAADSPKFPSTGNTVYTDSYDWAPQSLLGNEQFPLYGALRYYTKAGNLLQTLKFLDLRIDSASERINVGGRGEVQLGLRGSRFEFSGANPTV
jgi:hypothetical protein